MRDCWDIDNVRLTTPISAAWTGTGGNMNWSNSGNWTGGVPNFAGATAVIDAEPTSPITITLDSPQTVGSLTLGSTNGMAVTISGTGGNTLTLDNLGSGATISAMSGGTHDIDAPVVLAENLTVSGSGTLAFGESSSITDNGNQYSLTMSGAAGCFILSGSDSYSGGTNVSAGTLIVTSQTALPDGSALSVGAKILVHGIRQRVGTVVAAVVLAARGEEHQLLRVLHGEFLQDELIDQSEDGGVRTDAQRQRENRHASEQGGAAQHP